MKQTNAKALLEVLERSNAATAARIAQLEAKLAQLEPLAFPGSPLPSAVTNAINAVTPSEARATSDIGGADRAPEDGTKVDAARASIESIDKQIDATLGAMEQTTKEMRAQVDEALSQTETAPKPTDAELKPVDPKAEQYKKIAKRGAVVFSALAGVYAVVRVVRRVVGA